MKLTTPKSDGFAMPAEFDRHHGTILVFPERPGSWRYGAKAAQQVFAEIAARLAQCEQVYMLVNERTRSIAETMLPQAVRLLDIPTDDAWARDIAPTMVRNAAGAVRGISWQFNAWGGDYDGLYPDYQQDDAAADAICTALGIYYYDARPFVLEGGAIHSDGEGTVLVTEPCLLSKGRNPEMTKAQITEQLREYLGAEKVIWLPYGIYNDETNEHIDNVCAFTAPGADGGRERSAVCDEPCGLRTALPYNRRQGQTFCHSQAADSQNTHLHYAGGFGRLRFLCRG